MYGSFIMSAATTRSFAAYRSATIFQASAYSSCWWPWSAKNDRRAAISSGTPAYNQSGMPTPAHFTPPLLVERLPKAGDQWLWDMCRITARPRLVSPCTTRSRASRYCVFQRGSVTVSPDVPGWSGCRFAQERETRTVLNPQASMFR